MAIIFQLWVECESWEDTKKQADHFKELEFTLISGLTLTWNVEIEWLNSGTSGISVCCPQLSRYGIRNVQDAIDMSEAGIQLYHHLLTAPPFLFSQVAVEPNISAAQLEAFFALRPYGFKVSTSHFSCVLHHKLEQQIGPLHFYKPFRPGYVWSGYVGESYRPLGSNDNPQLQALYQQLLSG